MIEICPRCAHHLDPDSVSPGMFCCPCGDWDHPAVCLDCHRLIYSHLEAHPIVKNDIPDIGGFNIFPKAREFRSRVLAAWEALRWGSE